MTVPAKTATPAPRRSGSEKRQRGAPVSVRFLDDERAIAKAKAAEAGLSLASYLRAAGLGDPGIRAQRAPTVNVEVMARATAALNKVGSNLNQVAHALNSARALAAGEAEAALAEVREILALFREAAGRKDAA
jgi:hypothetical protein